ncbi:1-acyl-sn-glycerol-3-phosphate acyltransferase [Thalassotalea castellviae]|uniref:1-acyl-sn-glycerol-3-phosphate acyltransferase n=1 Tax=Thalassotalea castellviae TaxID=3075612 RepID=A0ABU2ZXH3_9GAMM|nr:1-acyl-sn-glycerol-3-phosphate acyltransferase [Thalassotalea sp. W431]MDT0602637.1 1-acyl-sn-glycerol-3-phosphate acyltransferase [Thalassotalea sp. W431]
MTPKIPAGIPQTNYRLVRRLSAKLLTLFGWKIIGNFPAEKKFILAVAPHTSNWDFIVSVLVMLSLNLKVTFMGKKSIFVWPLRWFLEKIGGVPVDRKHPQGVVGQMVDVFNNSQSMILALSPEGTRSKTKQWKTGFIIIAKQANVPIIPISLDFRKKEVEIHRPYIVQDDIQQALMEIKRQFVDVCAKNPHLV